MQKKVLYWSPHINREVATVKAVLNSAYSLSKYDNNFKPIIVNTFGEWDNYSEKLKELDIGSIKIFNWKINLSINGFL
jgi:hypothetical protein